jgi:ATP-dependent Lon protease
MKTRKFPPRIEKILKDELSQLKMLPDRHPEFNLKRNYIELLVSLPFGIVSEDKFSISSSAEILSKTHFGME